MENRESDLPLISTYDEAIAHDQNRPAFVELPGDMVRAVMWIREQIINPQDEKTRQLVQLLLAGEQK